MSQNRHILTFVINVPTMALGHILGTINLLKISIAAEKSHENIMNPHFPSLAFLSRGVIPPTEDG